MNKEQIETKIETLQQELNELKEQLNQEDKTTGKSSLGLQQAKMYEYLKAVTTKDVKKINKEQFFSSLNSKVPVMLLVKVVFSFSKKTENCILSTISSVVLLVQEEKIIKIKNNKNIFLTILN